LTYQVNKLMVELKCLVYQWELYVDFINKKPLFFNNPDFLNGDNKLLNIIAVRDQLVRLSI